MPRISSTIQCELKSGVNPESLGEAISNAIKGLTGNDIQVVVNTRDKPGQSGRINMWQMQQAQKRGNIELRPPSYR